MQDYHRLLQIERTATLAAAIRAQEVRSSEEDQNDRTLFDVQLQVVHLVQIVNVCARAK